MGTNVRAVMLIITAFLVNESGSALTTVKPWAARMRARHQLAAVRADRQASPGQATSSHPTKVAASLVVGELSSLGSDRA